MGMLNTDKSFLTIGDMTEQLGVSRSTLRRMVQDGRVPRPLELAPGTRRWLAADIAAWINSKRKEAGYASVSD
jgi:excisionase family DNA binding protein